MGFIELIYYNLNRKGLCTNMEINNFFDKINKDITLSGQSLLDQRLKLNPEVFIELNKTYLEEFYTNFKSDVKTYKGYILKAIDGSDFEIPNTIKSRNTYGRIQGKIGESVPRATVSTVYDLLNNYIIDGAIEKYRTPEIEMAIKHIEKDQEITNGYESIYIMDRGYVSLEFMIYLIKNNIKFLSRLKSGYYAEEIEQMAVNDAMVEIKHTRARMKKELFKNQDLRNYARAQNHTKIRIVKCILNTGEIEYLITNIDNFSYEEIVTLYGKRWGIETLYHSLKCKLQIEKFTSSSKVIIEQDFFSSILVYNMVQAMKNEAEEKIEQKKYKYEMKVNENIAIGLFKNEMIDIMMEENDIQKSKKYNKLCTRLLRYRIPVRKDRKFAIQFRRDNEHSYNKLKSF